MSGELLSTYLPMDRRQALAAGNSLPDRGTASVLFADIAGFTPLTEALVTSLGPRRGAEELTRLLNTVYTALVSRVHHFGGSVICFIGDALIGCFNDDQGSHALACALQMQETMEQFQTVPVPQGGPVSLAMKAAVAAGPVRRFLVGNPQVQLLDLLAGATVDQLAEAEHVATRGEVIATPEVARRAGHQLVIDEWRGPFAVVRELKEQVAPMPWPALFYNALTPQQLRSYLLPPVFDRVASGHGEFLAELRPIVALFLRFGGLDYDHDNEARGKLDAFAGWVQRVLSRYGGYLLLLTAGDKGSHLYAVFGALDAHEDDCERAVAAAIDLKQPPTELDFISGTQIGVSQGRARVGAYGGETRRTYSALGEAVNLAARLMEAAPVGEIRCSRQVYELARRRWDFETLPKVTLKGIAQAQALYRPMARARKRAIRDESDLIGRRAELETLKNSVQMAQAGSRRLLLLEGEAGIGKSRLVNELCQLATGSGIAWLLGAGDSVEQHTPYRAWREIMLSLFNLNDGMDMPEQRHRVQEQVTDLSVTYEDRAPLLNDIIGLDFPETNLTRSYDPKLRQASLAALVGELLERKIAIEPLVLIVEDAHWLDSLSWELAVSVARALVEQPLLLVLTLRPLEEPVRPQYSALSKLEGAQRLRLESLPFEETVALAAAQLGLASSALPADVAELVAERAAGNPFFASELICALRDRGLIVVEDGDCTVVGDTAALRESVPDTLEGVVLSRLDRLSAEQQLTLKVAAVIGRSFLFRTLHEVYPKQILEDELQTHLAGLSQRSLTLLEAEEPEPSYVFKHVFTQQVTYDTLLFGQRRELHRTVAGWYEQSYAENLSPHYQLLVFHWNRAGNAEYEYRYCRLAGQQAATQYANAEAITYFSRALELIERQDNKTQTERRFGVLQQRAKVYALLGRVEEERSDLNALLSVAERLASASKQSEVLLLWSDFHTRGGQFEDALERAENALAIMAESNDAPGEARALMSIGNALEGRGEFHEARDRVNKALSLFCSSNELEGQATSLKSLGIVSARLGEYSRAMEHFVDARNTYRRLDNKKGEADMLGNLGALHYHLGNYEQVIEYTKQAQQLFHAIGNLIGSAKCLTNLGNSYSALGEFAEGLRYHQQALDVYKQLEDDNGCADCYCNLGIAHEALGVGGNPELLTSAHGECEELAKAVDCYTQALNVYTRIGNRRGETLAYFNLGSTHLCRGITEEAELLLESSLKLSRELGLDHHAARTLSALARSSIQNGSPAKALEQSAQAIELLGNQVLPEADEIHFTQFVALMANGRAEDAIPHLEIAHQAVIQRSEAINDEVFRESSLAAYKIILAAWKKHRPTPPS